MTYVPPTAADFLARFPSFSEVAPSALNAILAEAVNAVGATWTERDRPLAVMYLAAHLLAGEGFGVAGGGPGGGGAAVTGPVRRRKVGDVETEFSGVSRLGGGSSSGGAAAEFQTTVYGKRYLRLLRLNHPGPLVV
jgi:hypothetical protein